MVYPCNKQSTLQPVKILRYVCPNNGFELAILMLPLLSRSGMCPMGIFINSWFSLLLGDVEPVGGGAWLKQLGSDELQASDMKTLGRSSLLCSQLSQVSS